MDVRLSPEQVALRDCRGAGRRRAWARTTVAELDDAERAAKLDAAVRRVGLARAARRRPTTGAPWASAVEVAVVAEELGRGLADAAFLGPTLAAELRRLAGAPAGGGARDGRAGGRPGAACAERPRAARGRRRAWRSMRRRRRRRWCSSRGDGGHCARHGRARAGRAAGVDLTRPVARWPPPAAVQPWSTGSAARSAPTTSRRWQSLGLAADLRRPRRRHARRAGADHRLRPDAAAVRRAHRFVPGGAAPAGRRASSPWRARAASPCTRRGRSTRCRPPTRSPRRRRPRPTAPAPPARCARRPFRCTAASATPGSAWPTSSCAGPCSRATCSAASGANLDRVLAARGVGGDDGLR